MVQRLGIVAGALLVLCPAMSLGDDGIADHLYGKGVHAFFEGDFVQAHTLLTEAISAGSQDPRAYYFRGLAYSKLGREEEAEQDFTQGSALESSDIERLYNISKALERVQGADRMKIEKHRIKARLAAYQKAEQLRRARYEQLRREESRVLEQQSKAAPAPAGKGLPVAPDVSFGEPPTREPAAKPAVVPGKPAGEEPSAEPVEPAAKPGVVASPADENMTPAAPDAADGADPFAPSPVAEKKPAAKRPAADSGAAPAKKKPAAKEPAADESDPFAAPAEKKAAPKKKPAADNEDPFAAPADDNMAAPAEKAESKPAAKKPAADEEDPFAAPAEKKAAPKKKAAADDEDPFAAEPAPAKSGSNKASTKKTAKPKAKADDADPFATDAPEKQ